MSDEKKSGSHPVVNVDVVYLNEIIQKLSGVILYQTFPSGKRFSINPECQSYIYIIRSGSISLIRQRDDILVELLHAPLLRGAIPNYSSSYIIKVIEQADIAILNKEDFYQLLTEYNLWESFARHMQQLAAIGVETIFKLSASSAFEIVRSQLYELMSKPFHIRESITVENYINSKTRLSRSAIFRVIADLRTGGYIVVENGILKEIKSIPYGY